MARNQKLAPLLAGRAVAAVEPPAARAAPAGRFAPPGETWTVRLADGSALAVRTDGTAPEGADAAGTAAVTDVVQRGTTLTLALAGGRAVVFHLAEESGCVLLRDAAGAMAYAG